MADLLPVADAVARIIAGVVPLTGERVNLAGAEARTLAEPLAALRTQPPFDASSMDGYAVRSADIVTPPARLRVIGSAPAGGAFGGSVGAGEAVRIFTGAPVPPGADSVLIQENTEATDGGFVVAKASTKPGQHIRKTGLDFRKGDALLATGRDLGMRELALAAAMGHGDVPVRRRPRVAVLATGDELVPPGTMPAANQIVASSGPGIAAYARSLGAEVRDFGIAKDDAGAIAAAADKAAAWKADVLVTLGGASVGDHDLVSSALGQRGMALYFWKIAMRPGKPLMFGRIGGMKVLGLPGNPVSSVVCSILFLRPLIDALLGRRHRDISEPAVLGAAMAANDGREDYVRAKLASGAGLPVATALPVQDSSMLGVLAKADCLLIRVVHAPAAKAGDACRVIRLP
jgi:molybdopterin molybdotransferase